MTRRWAVLVALLGILITCGFAYRVAHKPGVYWAQTDVLFLPPPSSTSPNALLDDPSDVITLAGVVGKMVDPDSASARVVSPTVRLINQGIRHGHSVTLPNDGGQWTNNFDKALLDVQAVGSSRAEVTRTVTRLIKEINAKLAGLQVQGHVKASSRVVTVLNPSRVQVYYDKGRPARAVGATILLGLAITAVAVVLTRRWLPRWLAR